MKYLKNFETTPQYQEYIEGEEAILPNVSCVTDDNQVYYNPEPGPLEAALRTLQNEGYSTAVKSQPIAIELNHHKVLAVYGEKTVDGELYSKVTFFADSEEYCYTYDAGSNQEIVQVKASAISSQWAEHEIIDLYRDVSTLTADINKLNDACVGKVPSSI